MMKIKESYNLASEIYDSLGLVCEGEIFGSRLYAFIVNNFSHLWTDQNHISKHKNGTFKKFAF